MTSIVLLFWIASRHLSSGLIRININNNDCLLTLCINFLSILMLHQESCAPLSLFDVWLTQISRSFFACLHWFLCPSQILVWVAGGLWPENGNISGFSLRRRYTIGLEMSESFAFSSRHIKILNPIPVRVTPSPNVWTVARLICKAESGWFRRTVTNPSNSSKTVRWIMIISVSCFLLDMITLLLLNLYLLLHWVSLLN